MKFVETLQELRDLYGPPSEAAVKKQMDRLDPHARAFLARSPFVTIGSQDADGGADVTPKGDQPGFVAVLDDHTIAIPDRPGNARVDTWANLIENPAVGLLFMIPGMQETLRINGTARLTVDADLCARLAAHGKPAKAVLVVAIDEVFLHCAKAYIRSGLWKPETWPDRKQMPTLGEMLRDQIETAQTPAEIDARLDTNYRTALW